LQWLLTGSSLLLIGVSLSILNTSIRGTLLMKRSDQKHSSTYRILQDVQCKHGNTNSSVSSSRKLQKPVMKREGKKQENSIFGKNWEIFQNICKCKSSVGGKSKS